MKKVLHIQLLPLLSGVQRVSLNEIHELNRDHPNEFEFSLVCNSEGPLTDELKKEGVSYFILPDLKRNISPVSDLKALYKLYALMKKNKFDIVHTHSSKTGCLGRIAAKLAGVPKVLHTVHGFSFPAAQNKISKLVFYTMEWIAKFATDELIVLNKYDYEIAVNQLKFKEKIVNIIPNGVDVNKFSPSQAKSDSFKVIMVGRLWEQKNPKCLLLAAKLLLDKYKNIKVDFIGDGELRESLESYIKSNNLSDNVNILGWSNNVEEMLPHYDLFVLPSLWEGLPLAILEAQACGLPTIVSDIPGNSDLVIDGVNGFLFEKNNDVELSEKIERTYLNSDLCLSLSNAARSHVCTNYSSQIRNDKILNLYYR